MKAQSTSRRTRWRCGTYELRAHLHFLRYGMTSLPSTKQYSVMLSLKQIAKVAQLTVPKVNYRLRLHSEELSQDVPLDVAGVLRVQRPEGGQQVLVSGWQELLLQDYSDRSEVS